MLQKIDSMEWKTPRVGVLGTDFDNPVISADYDGTSLFIGEKDRPVLYVNFPDGVVLAQEVPAPADPFMPDEWPYSEYDWITHDASGAIVYWGSCPAVTSDGWTPWSEVDDFLEVGFRDLTGLDWRNSLRHRPDGA